MQGAVLRKTSSVRVLKELFVSNLGAGYLETSDRTGHTNCDVIVISSRPQSLFVRTRITLQTSSNSVFLSGLDPWVYRPVSSASRPLFQPQLDSCVFFFHGPSAVLTLKRAALRDISVKPPWRHFEETHLHLNIWLRRFSYTLQSRAGAHRYRRQESISFKLRRKAVARRRSLDSCAPPRGRPST